MTDQRIREVLAEACSGIVVIGEPHEAFYGIQNWPTFWLFKHYGMPLPEARSGQCHGAGRDSRRHGRAMRRPACHAPLIAVSRLIPIERHASRTLLSDRSRATALLTTGKARYVVRSCITLAATASNPMITTQSD